MEPWRDFEGREFDENDRKRIRFQIAKWASVEEPLFKIAQAWNLWPVVVLGVVIGAASNAPDILEILKTGGWLP